MIEKIKRLAGETAIYGTFTIIGRFLTFLLTPIYTNYMSVEENGVIAYIYSLIVFLNVIYSLGLESSYFRFYTKNNQIESQRVFTLSYFGILAVSVVFTIFMLLFSSIITPSLTSLPDGLTLVRLAILIPLIDSMMVIPYALLRMTHRARRFAVIRFSLVILAVALNILFVVLLRHGAMGVIEAQLISSIVGACFFIPEIIKNLRFDFKLKLLSDMLKFGIPTVPASISAIILQVADRPILKAMTNEVQVGIYQINYRLGIPMMLFVSMFEYAWKPFYLSNFEEADAKQTYSRVLTYFTLISSVIFLVIGFFIEFIIRIPFLGGKFINPEYWTGLGIIPIILGGYYFNGVFTNLAAGCHITKNTKYLPIAAGVGALLNIIMNITLIPYYGIYGAAWATLVAYFVTAVIIYFISRKIYPITYEYRRLFIILIGTLSVYFATTIITIDLDLTLSFIIKLISLLVFVVLLRIMGFFSASEINRMKGFMRNKSVNRID